MTGFVKFYKSTMLLRILAFLRATEAMFVNINVWLLVLIWTES